MEMTVWMERPDLSEESHVFLLKEFAAFFGESGKLKIRESAYYFIRNDLGVKSHEVASNRRQLLPEYLNFIT